MPSLNRSVNPAKQFGNKRDKQKGNFKNFNTTNTKPPKNSFKKEISQEKRAPKHSEDKHEESTQHSSLGDA